MLPEENSKNMLGAIALVIAVIAIILSIVGLVLGVVVLPKKLKANQDLIKQLEQRLDTLQSNQASTNKHEEAEIDQLEQQSTTGQTQTYVQAAELALVTVSKEYKANPQAFLKGTEFSLDTLKEKFNQALATKGSQYQNHFKFSVVNGMIVVSYEDQQQGQNNQNNQNNQQGENQSANANASTTSNNNVTFEIQVKTTELVCYKKEMVNGQEVKTKIDESTIQNNQSNSNSSNSNSSLGNQNSTSTLLDTNNGNQSNSNNNNNQSNNANTISSPNTSTLFN